MGLVEAMQVSQTHRLRRVAKRIPALTGWQASSTT